MNISSSVWTVLEASGGITLRDIIELGQRSGVEPSEIEVRLGYEAIEVGYMRKKGDHEMAVELSNLKAAIREQNTEYKRLGLL